MKRLLGSLFAVLISWSGLAVDWKYDTKDRVGVFADTCVFTAVCAEIVEPWEAALLGTLSAEMSDGTFDTRCVTVAETSHFLLSFNEVPMCLIVR